MARETPYPIISNNRIIAKNYYLMNIFNHPNFLYKEITIRPLSKGDAEELYNSIEYNRDYLREWCPWLDDNTSINDSLSFIDYATEENIKGTSLILGIFNGTNVIGVLSLDDINASPNQAEIDYWLHKDYQGKGIMTWAGSKIIYYGFNNLNLTKIILHSGTENEGSNKIAIKLGFKHTGITPNGEFLYDHYIDLNSYLLTKEEWQKLEHNFLPRV
jgi:ribosomal-protein-serine acetyltransferase